MELFPFVSFSKKEIFVLARVPHEILRTFADRNNFIMLLDATEIQAAAKQGDPERNIASFDVAHDETVTAYKPYDFIYSRFTRTVPEKLYSIPYGGRLVVVRP